MPWGSSGPLTGQVSGLLRQRDRRPLPTPRPSSRASGPVRTSPRHPAVAASLFLPRPTRASPQAPSPYTCIRSAAGPPKRLRFDPSVRSCCRACSRRRPGRQRGSLALRSRSVMYFRVSPTGRRSAPAGRPGHRPCSLCVVDQQLLHGGLCSVNAGLRALTRASAGESVADQRTMGIRARRGSHRGDPLPFFPKRG